MFKITGILLLGAGLMMPLAAQPQRDHDDERREERQERRDRYYDQERRDYHGWNEAETRAWHRYWQERRHAAVDWERANEEQRRAYWRWRHEHSDSILWPDRR